MGTSSSRGSAGLENSAVHAADQFLLGFQRGRWHRESSSCTEAGDDGSLKTVKQAIKPCPSGQHAAIGQQRGISLVYIDHHCLLQNTLCLGCQAELQQAQGCACHFPRQLCDSALPTPHRNHGLPYISGRVSIALPTSREWDVLHNKYGQTIAVILLKFNKVF